jgi:hypothetical protein
MLLIDITRSAKLAALAVDKRNIIDLRGKKMLKIDDRQIAKQSRKASWLIFAFVSLFAVTATFSACVGGRTENITSVKFSVSASVEWDNDFQGDGVQFTLRPLDDTGFLVRDNLLINAKLWKQQGDNNTDNLTLIQEWEGISVTKKDFDQYGAGVRLEFTNYVPSQQDSGILAVEAFAPDGRKFSFQESNVRLGYYNILNIGTTCNPTAGSSSCCPTK